MTDTTLRPLAAPAGSGYFTVAGTPALVQGYAVPAPSEVTEEALERLAGSGGTMIRLWSDFYERGSVDVESLRRVRIWAERLDLRILMVLFSPAFLSDIYEERSRFDQGLTMFNGLIDRHPDVVTSAAALDALAGRCREVLSAFEDSPALAGWELVNQADDLYDVEPAAMAAFVERLSARVRAEDRAYGVTRLVTASSTQPVPPDWVLDLDGLDFVAIHPYADAVEFPVNRFDGAVHVAGAIRYAIERSPVPRPVLDTESGVIGQLYVPGLPRPDADFRAELMHNLRWAHFAAGGAGTGIHIPINDVGLTAPRRVPFSRLRWEPMAPELDDIAAIARVAADRPGHGPVRPSGGATGLHTPGAHLTASVAGGRMIGWVLRDTRDEDFAADAARALAGGPTRPANLDLRLHVLDMWRWALARRSLEPITAAARKSVSLLLGRGRPGTPRGCAVIDEWLAHLHHVTRRLAPDLLEPPAAGTAGVTVTVDGLEAARYEIRWIDDRDGRTVASHTTAGPALRCTSPAFDRHIALTVSPAGPAGTDQERTTS
jgi:hypothetical protein